MKLLQDTSPQKIKDLELQIAELNGQIQERRSNAKERYDSTLWELERKKNTFEREIKSFPLKERILNIGILQPEEIPVSKLKEFELSNLIRLGLVKYIQKPYANSQTLEIPFDMKEQSRGYLNIDLEIDVDTDENYLLTELGELCVDACSEKK